MQAQLAEVQAQFESALARLQRLNAGYTNEEWVRRPEEGSWSAAECVGHLNLTSEKYVPLVRDAVARAHALAGGVPGRFRRDPVGWLIWKSVGPGGGFKTKTSAAFIPLPHADKAPLIEEFERLQRTQIELLQSVDGLPIQRVQMSSPFSDRVRYSLYSALTILPAHQHRHLDQAERAAERVRRTQSRSGSSGV